jgi:hypothetical protein
MKAGRRQTPFGQVAGEAALAKRGFATAATPGMSFQSSSHRFVTPALRGCAGVKQVGTCFWKRVVAGRDRR